MSRPHRAGEGLVREAGTHASWDGELCEVTQTPEARSLLMHPSPPPPSPKTIVVRVFLTRSTPSYPNDQYSRPAPAPACAPSTGTGMGVPDGLGLGRGVGRGRGPGISVGMAVPGPKSWCGGACGLSGQCMCLPRPPGTRGGVRSSRSAGMHGAGLIHILFLPRHGGVACCLGLGGAPETRFQALALCCVLCCVLGVTGRGGGGTRDPRSGGAHVVDGRDNAWRSRAPGPHAHGNAARQVVDGLWTEVCGQQTQSNVPGNNQHNPNPQTTGRR